MLLEDDHCGVGSAKMLAVCHQKGRECTYQAPPIPKEARCSRPPSWDWWYQRQSSIRDLHPRPNQDLLSGCRVMFRFVSGLKCRKWSCVTGDTNGGSGWWWMVGDLQPCRPVAGRPGQGSNHLWCEFPAKDPSLEPGEWVGKNKARYSWISLCRLSEAATARLDNCSGRGTVHFGGGTGTGSTEPTFCGIAGVAMGRRYEGQGGRNR